MMDKKRIVLIGSGNVAWHIGRRLQASCQVVQVYSRTRSHAERLAHELGIDGVATRPAELATDAEVYIMAVSDDAIAGIAGEVPDNGALWLHTAGSVALDVLSAHRRLCGVLYPMQSFSRQLDVDWSQVPVFVEGNSAEATARVRELAAMLSPHVEVCDSRQRAMLHVAAVFSCNFANYLWVTAADLLEQHGLDFGAMMPLLRSTVAKLDGLSPAESQTGPAVRGDRGVMNKHLDMLAGDERARGVYELLSRAIASRFEVATGGSVPDFSRIRGIAFDVDGVLSPSTIPMHPSGEPMRMVNIKDGYAIQLAVKLGLPMAIITGANVEAVRVRFEGLGMTDVHLGAAHKLPVLHRWMGAHQLRADEVMYVGDDIPDIPVMRHVGLAVAPADACPEVLAVARYVTPCRGGDGVARHLIEHVLKAQGTWLHDEHAFGW